MAGRGRGGGRGRGRGMTFDPRDMGFGAGEQLPGPVLQPPPTFPPLDYQPAQLLATPEMEYMVALKKDFIVFMKDHLSVTEKDELLKNIDSLIDWRFLPTELKAKRKLVCVKKRGPEASVSQIKKATFDLNALDALEKLEETTDEPETEKDTTEEKTKGEEEENEEDEEEDVDEEMDDGTDYVNNYFDNGEGFEDDDDIGNDGPVY